MMRFRREQHNLCIFDVCIGIYQFPYKDLHVITIPLPCNIQQFFMAVKTIMFKRKKLIIFLFLLKT